jgi:predicted methyltransferase
VDITPRFLEHIRETCRTAGKRNVTPVLCSPDSVDLPANSVDAHRTLASLERAIKPGGRLVVIDFRRVPGESSEWILNHVRAGQDVVEKEITAAGFVKENEVKGLLKENYFVIFTRPSGK